MKKICMVMQKLLILFCFTVSLCAMEEREHHSASLLDLCIQKPSNILSLKTLCIKLIGKKVINSDYTVDESKLPAELLQSIKDEIIKEKGFWNLQDPSILCHISSVHWSPDETKLAIISPPCGLLIFDSEAQEYIQQVKSTKGCASGNLRWNKNSTYFSLEKSNESERFEYIGSYNQLLKEWVLNPLTIQGKKVVSMIWNPDGSMFAKTIDSEIYIADYNHNDIKYQVLDRKCPLPLDSVLWNATGEYAVLCDQNLYILLYNEAENRWDIHEKEINLENMSWNPNPKYKNVFAGIIAENNDRKLCVGSYDKNELKTNIVESMPHEKILNVAWHPDGEILMVATDDSRIYKCIYDARNGITACEKVWQTDILESNSIFGLLRKFCFFAWDTKGRYFVFATTSGTYIGILDESVLDIKQLKSQKCIWNNNIMYYPQPCVNENACLGVIQEGVDLSNGMLRPPSIYIWNLGLLRYAPLTMLAKKCKE